MTDTIFFRLLDEVNKPSRLSDAIDELREGGETADVSSAEPESLRQVPGSPFAYWVSEEMRSKFAKLPSFESEGREIRVWRSVFGIGEGDAELLERLIREQLVQAQPKEQEGKTPPEGLPEVIRRWELVIPSFRGPNGNVGPVLTAWALAPDVGEGNPHLVTAFPLV